MAAAGASTLDTRAFDSYGELSDLMRYRVAAVTTLVLTSPELVSSDITAAAPRPPKGAGRDVVLIYAALIEELEFARASALGEPSRLQAGVAGVLQDMGISAPKSMSYRVFELWEAHAAITHYPKLDGIPLAHIHDLYRERIGHVSRLLDDGGSEMPWIMALGLHADRTQPLTESVCVLAEYVHWYNELTLPVEFVRLGERAGGLEPRSL